MKIKRILFSNFLIVVIFFLIAFFAWSKLVFDNKLQVSGTLDWDQRYVYSESNKISLLSHKQIPLWNSYHCGGFSEIGNPQNDIFSPNTLAALLFGPIVGYKVMFFIFMFIGLMGFYRLGLKFGISVLGSVFLSCTYMLSGLIIIPFAVGMTVFLNFSLLPWLYFFYLEALENKNIKFIFFCSLTLAAFFFNGFHYLPLPIIFLFLVGLLKSIVGKTLRPLLTLLLILFIFLPLISVKFIPSLAVLLNGSNSTLVNKETASGYSLKSLVMSLLSKEQTDDAYNNWGRIWEVSFFDGMSYQIDENGMYVGLPAVVLFFLGLIYMRKKWELILILTFFLILGFGFNLEPSIYRVLYDLPILENMRVAQRYRYFFMVPFVLFVGFGFDYFYEKSAKIIKSKKIRGAFFSGLIALVVYHQANVNLSYFSSAFNYFHEPLAKSENFVQACGADLDEYRYVQAGLGSRDCSDPLMINIGAKCRDEAGYRGEYYLKNNKGELKQIYWSQNKIKFETDVNDQDTLVVNQNYSPGWKVKIDGEVRKNADRVDGLISTTVSKNNKVVEFYYLPDSFVLGAYISLVSILLIMAVLFKRVF